MKGYIMAEEKKLKLLGMISTICGVVFMIAGIIIFFMSNYMNFQMKKAEATIVGMYNIETSEGETYSMLELTYRVGSEMVFATYEYPGVLGDDVTTLEIYYDVKQPTMVFDKGWYLEPLLVSLLGIPLLVVGLYYTGKIRLDLFELTPPEKKATNTQKELYIAKKTVMENALPMLAGILFLIFGSVMIAMDRGWWAWIFVVVGLIELIYIGMEFVPALVTWIQLSRVSNLKVKATVYDVDASEDDLESLEIKDAKSEKKDSKKKTK
ncbi:MAG: hypothetical protein IJA29_09115 [Lachnospiraceae bacterium]|nr:hypothetical protein [Lachnospiraceae bacterium]